MHVTEARTDLGTLWFAQRDEETSFELDDLSCPT